jgi:hypothetical protein
MIDYESIGGKKQYARGNYREVVEYRQKGVEYNGNLCVSDQWVVNLYSGDTKVMRFVSKEEPTEETFKKDIEFYEKMVFGEVIEDTTTSTETSTDTSSESVEDLEAKLTEL